MYILEDDEDDDDDDDAGVIDLDDSGFADLETPEDCGCAAGKIRKTPENLSGIKSYRGEGAINKKSKLQRVADNSI